MSPTHHVYTFTHGFNAATRSHPALSFTEKYYAHAQNPDFRKPYNTWYAHDTIGYHTDDSLFPSSSAIREEAKAFMEPFSHFDMEVHVIRLIPGVTIHEEPKDRMPVVGDLVLLETTTLFFLKEDGPDWEGKGIRVPRFVSLLIGKANEGEGTDGMQIFEAKSWWDSWILIREMEKRKGGNGESGGAKKEIDRGLSGNKGDGGSGEKDDEDDKKMESSDELK